MTRAAPHSVLRMILAAIERGDNDQAVELLTPAELEAFTTGQPVAGDLGWARWRLAGGDVDGATDELRRLDGGAA